MSSGLIINPKSGKQSGHGLALAEKLDGKAGVCTRILHDFSDLDSFIAEFARRKVNTIFISSGDGTIQAIQTILAEQRPFGDKLPRLCLLPHGTTNMTAADLGFRHKNLARQAHIIADDTQLAATTDIQQRASVRIANPRDGKARHGMFVGTGAVWNATLYCQGPVHKTGLKGNWATFATLGLALGKALFTKADPADKTRIDRAYDMAVAAENQTLASGGQLLFLATTLQKLVNGVRPFWGHTGGQNKLPVLRASLFPYPPPNLVRWIRPALWGAEDRKMPAGCISFAADTIAVTTACPFVLDGEFFEPPHNEPLIIEKGPLFTYVRG